MSSPSGQAESWSSVLTRLDTRHPAWGGEGRVAGTLKLLPSLLPPPRATGGCRERAPTQRIVHFIPSTESLSSGSRASLPPPRLPRPDRPYRTSKLRRLPAGPPETRASPAFVRHGCGEGGRPGRVGDNGYRDSGWRWWPRGLRQPVHPAAEAAEMEIRGGGREQPRRGRGARRRGGGEELERESWDRGDGGGAAGVGGGSGKQDEGAWRREPGAQEGFRRLSDRCCGAWWDPPFLALCQLSPHFQMPLPKPTRPHPRVSSRGHSGKHSPA